MANLLDEKNIVLALNLIKFKRTSSLGEIKTYAGPGNEGLHLLNWINNQITLGNITITSPTDIQAKIQFADEGVNLGTDGTVVKLDFVGDGVTATRVGNIVTITVPGATSSGQPAIQWQDEGIDLGTPGEIDNIDFVGSSVNVSKSGSSLTVEIEGTTLVEYDAGNGVRILATDTGVTASWSSGELTITSPSGVRIITASVSLADGTNVQSGADAGGATNWIRVKFANTTGYNTTATNMKVPSVQKCFYASGAPSVSNAYSIDLDNNPNIAVVGVGSIQLLLEYGI
jgi:hypothetical protein